jgi:hypothetical protein
MNYDDIPIPTHNKISFTSKNEKDIAAYLEYRSIVGTDDNGVLMSESEYEAYKKKVAPLRKNKLYIFWINSSNFECKAIGPESMCFCNHRFKYHNFDNVKDKKVNCKDKKCKCKLYDYVPVYGANDVKCLCHHSYREHELGNRKCKRNNCKCIKFSSKFTCNCGEGYDTHKTVIYTKEERIKMGKPVEVGWFGNSLAGGIQNYGEMINDVYDTEFKNMEREPIGKKIMYKNGVPVNNEQDIFGKNDIKGSSNVKKMGNEFNNNFKNDVNNNSNFNNNFKSDYLNKNFNNLEMDKFGNDNVIGMKNVNKGNFGGSKKGSYQNFHSGNNGGTDYYNKNYKV